MGIGGYHDEALRAAQDEWLGLSVGTTERDRAEPLAFALGGGDPSALTNFTPRFGGLGAAASDTQHPGLVNQGQPGPTRQVEIGLGDTSTIAGFAVDWSAKANVGQEAAGQPGGRRRWWSAASLPSRACGSTQPTASGRPFSASPAAA